MSDVSGFQAIPVHGIHPRALNPMDRLNHFRFRGKPYTFVERAGWADTKINRQYSAMRPAKGASHGVDDQNPQAAEGGERKR